MLKIGTLNLRNIWNLPSSSMNQKRRAPLICRLIREEQPDIMGLQECSPWMFSYLEKHLKEYRLLRTSRGRKYEEDNPILYLSKQISLKEGSSKIISLSHHPEIPLSRSFASFQPRKCTMATFSWEGEELHFYNTHLDIFPWANRTQLKIIERYLSQKIPLQRTIVLGDFNMQENQNLRLFQEHLDLYDLSSCLTSTFRSRPHAKPLDHVFCSPDLVIESVVKNDRIYDGMVPSDHSAIFVKMKKS